MSCIKQYFKKSFLVSLIGIQQWNVLYVTCTAGHCVRQNDLCQHSTSIQKKFIFKIIYFEVLGRKGSIAWDWFQYGNMYCILNKDLDNFFILVPNLLRYSNVGECILFPLRPRYTVVYSIVVSWFIEIMNIILQSSATADSSCVNSHNTLNASNVSIF